MPSNVPKCCHHALFVTESFFLPSHLIRSQSVVEAGTLKHEEKGENENTQPLLALD